MYVIHVDFILYRCDHYVSCLLHRNCCSSPSPSRQQRAVRRALNDYLTNYQGACTCVPQAVGRQPLINEEVVSGKNYIRRTPAAAAASAAINEDAGA